MRQAIKFAGVLAIVLFMVGVFTHSAAAKDRKDKVPCQLIYEQYEANRQFDLKLFGSELKAGSTPVPLQKIDENDAQLRRDMYTLCEQYNADPQMTL